MGIIMFVKPCAACGVVLLSGIFAISLCSPGPVSAASEGEAVAAVPAQEESLPAPETSPAWYQEATVGTPDRSLWRALPERTQGSQAAEPTLPALDRPMTLLNGLFEGSETSLFPHP